MSTTPKTKQDYWDKKFRENIERDQRAFQELRSAGWRVLLIWECSLKGKTKLGVESVIEKTIEWLVFGGLIEEIPPKIGG
jgi:DNA mismatch endonuclease (patch repair protein)